MVSERQPTEEQLADLKFAWLAVKHVKSNAITVAKGGRLLGMGSGQPNRVESVRIALKKAGDEAKVRVHELTPSRCRQQQHHARMDATWQSLWSRVLWPAVYDCK